LAVADAGNQVVEANETNNVAIAAVRLGSDLVVSSVGAPPIAAAGQTILVTDTTTNQGGSPAGSSTTSFYFSRDFAVDPSDTLLGGRAIPALTAGASSSGSTSVQIPAGTATGTYFIIGGADSGNQVAETNEANNAFVFAAIRVGPDLAVSTLTVPASAAAGTSFALSDTTNNQGGDAAPTSTTQYYLSTNLTLDGSDVLLGARSIPALAAGGSNSGSTTVTIPAGTAAGSYFVIAVADGPNSVLETFETNNTQIRGMSITGP
jgi:subtilase family serine protease